MNTALKPVLAPTGTQSPAAGAPSAQGKPQVMAQHAGAPGPYATGPLGHVSQNLGGLPHPHGNMGLSAPNMAMNTMPNLSQMGMNQPPAHNIQAAHNNPIKTQNLPAAPAVAGRPTHPYLSGGSAPPGPPQDEGTTLPPSQNSAQLMAVHRAQQQNQHVNQNQQHHDQPAQPTTPDRFKPQPPQVAQQPPVLQQQQQQVQQQPQIPQQSPTLQPVQSNGTVSAPETNNKVTVPTPPTETKTDSTAAPPAVQNHVAETNNDTSNAKQPENSIVNTVSQPVAEQKPAVAATPEQPPAPEVPQAATTPTKIAAVPKEERVVPVVKPPSTMKLATTPRTTNRKRETKKVESPKTSPSKTPDGKSTGAQNNRPPDKAKTPRTPSEERKSKRTRTRTQPYQSPLPELALISKLSNSAASPSKAQDEKLIVFYKNEFLAVRNAEGGFYVCQAVQNVYKSSLRIRIRWLSQDKQDKIYIPDFYDTTDFDCILTNLNMERVEKGKYNLPKDELERTENILKRALAVESGEATPSLTEEHPDGLDLSLFRDESQLKKKRKSSKRKSSSPNARSPSKRTKRTPDKSKSRKPSKSPAPKIVAKRNNQNQSSDRKSTSTVNSAEKKVEPVKITRKSDGGRAERAKRRGEAAPPTPVKTSPVVDQKKARVLAKVAMKTAISAATPQKKKAGRNTPTGNGKSASAAPKIGVKATRASSQSTPAPSTPAASASTSRRAKKTKK